MERDEFIDALLAVRPRLTGGEFSVALARFVGHVTHFDIKRATGIDVDRIRASEAGITTKCGANILRILGLTNKYIPKVSPQIVAAPPSQRALAYLLTQLGRNPVPHGADYKGFSKAYDLAYARSKRNHHAALLLIQDTIDMNLDSFRKSKYPGSFLPRILDQYASSIPKMPPTIYERMIAKKLSFRYNPKTKQWEQR